MKLKGNVLVITQWSYKDALVQTYTLPYVDIIRKIISTDRKLLVVTAEQQQIAITGSELNELNFEWAKKNMQLIAQPYKRFGWKKMAGSVKYFFKLYRIIKKEKIKIVHAFCTPAGSIAYLLSQLTGTELIIDSYEPHAESMVETGTWKKNGVAFKLLFSLEKKLTHSAKHVIATTHGMKKYAKEKYGVELKDFYIKPACIDFEHFYPRPKDAELLKEFSLDDKIVCVYAGKLGGTYLDDEVFDLIKCCYAFWKDRFRFLMLTNEADEKIGAQIQRIRIPVNVIIKRFVAHTEIPRYLSLGDFAINPQAPVPSKRFGSPIKDGEYWAMGLPIIISPGISDDSDIIRENEIGVVVNLLENENLPGAVEKMDTLLKTNKKELLQKKIFEIAKKYRSFETARRVYGDIYDNK